MNEDPHSLPDAPHAGPALRRAGAAIGEKPLRAQVFNAAQMAVHGRQLASHHVLSRHEGADGLREHLLDNADLIARAGASLTRAGKAGETLEPAAAGLLDHYHLIDEQIRVAHRALLQRDSRTLPCLGVPRDAAGQPRIYQLALELVAHGDGRIEHESLERFIAAYQEGAPLTLGELRALPDMLRLALIDNLRRIAVLLERGREQRKLARGWAERMLVTAEQRPGDLVLLVADMARAVPALDAPFVAELTRRLREGGTGLSQVLQWIGARLADQGLSVDRQLQLDSEARAADGVSAANSIDSLRLVAATDWPAFVETMGVAEQVLRRDPAGIYARMDGATRAHYRAALARLARETTHDETQVAAEALALAGQPRSPSDAGLDSRTRHIGHYLAGSGVATLRARLKTEQGENALHASLRSSLRDLAERKPLLLYLGTAGTLTLLCMAALLLRAYRDGAGLALLLALGSLALFGAGELALAATDALARAVTRALVPPRPLPRLEFSDGIPDEARTLVAVPAILRGSDDVAALAASLETHYLGNRERNLRFCLLTDFADAPAQTMPDDAALLDAARAAIAGLNVRYGGADGAAPFLLLQRPRVWSRSEGAWIGDARRQGQLADLAAFLRGDARERFVLAEGEIGALATLRHLCVLDSAARLAHGGVRRLVATLAHPLNQPAFDAAGRRVIAGHGLLQPRLAPALPGEAATRYERRAARLHGNGARLAQDLFGVVSCGVFPSDGQGLYEIDSLQRVLAQRLPTGALPAYLLPMGSALRCAQVDDVVLQAPVPARYGDDVARRHRSLRGQWQLALCLRRLDGLPPLARWTLLDGLRGALVAPSLLAVLLLCWALLPEPAFWGAAALSVFFLPAFGGVLAGLAGKPADMLWRQHLDNWWRDTRNALGQAAMRTVFLPHEAWIGLDAAARACWRMLVARRKLLEWCLPALARSSADMEANWRNMWFGPVLAVGSALLLTFLHPFALFAGAPLLLLWFLSPVLAWWVSQPRQQHAQRACDLSAQQTLFLARLARRTWGYFETAVGTSTNWLPPAALQQHPREMVVARTTPGDIGYGLLASLCAWDFGFIPQSDLLMRLRAAFDSIDLLERQRGHLYAGYDSGTLAPLEPLRVSTTESGTLAAHLLTLAGGLDALAEAPIASTRMLDGIRATLAVLDQHAQGAPQAVCEALAHCHAQLAPERCRNLDTLPGLADCLQGAAGAAAALVAALPEDADAGLRDWALRLDAGCAAALADLFALAPWIRAVQEYVLDASLTRIPTLRELAQIKHVAGDDVLARMVEEGAAGAQLRLQEIDALVRRARAFADMDFDFLYRPGSGLLAGGYDLAEERLEDATGYLASEARLASFVGIAQGRLPAAHWDALRRPICIVEGEQLLQSEDGALSDYLAPLLVMPTWRDTLLDRTYRAVVHAQIAYARRQDSPWGISRSGCNTVDQEMQYACRSFGVPGAGIRRGLADDLVIAPYAAMLALMVEPQAALANLERLAALGGIGEHGFYDAIDFTGARLPPGRKHAIVRAWRSRHQGMGLLALSSLLHGQPMARRFAADPQLRAALPLLQEQVARAGAFEPPAFELDAAQIAPPQTPLPTRVVRRPGALQPQVQLLSNGRYHVMVTSDGGGYSLREGLALTRWRGDAAGGDGGLFCHLRDLDSGALWSNAWQPTLSEPEHYEAVFSEGSVQLRRRDHGIALTTQIAVSPEDDVELRRIGIRNLSNRTRRIELTSFCEVALAAAGHIGPEDRPFAQSEILAGRQALLCTRHARAAGAAVPWLLHLMRVDGGASAAGAASFASSRTQLLGRGRGTPPMATAAPGPLAGRDGAVRDPVLAIRRVLTLAPGEALSVDLVLGAAAARDAALELVDRYAQADHADRVFELAWIRGQALLRHLNASEADCQLYGSLAGSVLYPNRALRADPAVIARNRRDRSSLLPLGPGGELPIVLAQVRGHAGLELVRQLLTAHAWWRLNGLVADLVVWYGDGSGYRQGLHQQIMAMVAACLGADMLDRPGGVFVRAIESIPDEDRILMQAAARVVLLDEHGSLAEQLRRALPAAGQAVSSPPVREVAAGEGHDLPLPELRFDNGIGGFSPDGREYLIRSGPGRAAPAPWPNLLANPAFGSLVDDSGVAHTWSGDPVQGRLTSPSDGLPGYGGEAFYVRDEEAGMFWSPTPLPAPSGGAYLTRHGFGYSVFEHLVHDIHSELTSFVAFDAPLKYTVLRLRNDGAAARRLSVTGYVEWVLGASRTEAAPHVVSARDPASGALLVRSAWNAGLADRTGFFHVDAEPASFTCDRMAFLGRGRDLAHPLALERAGLDGSLGAGFDPCAALQVAVSLQPGEQRELVFMLGVGVERDLGACIGRHQGALAAGVALDRVHAWWSETLGGLQIDTPDPSLDLLANGWLMYRAIAGGLWAGGTRAFGTGLQDAMAAVHLSPRLLRAQLLRCAAQQFVDGDVRTRSSSEHLWLPLALCRYVRTTGDFAVLDERLPYLEGRALEEGEAADRDLRRQAGEDDDLYGHCVRAIRRGLRVGPHGLPLADAGDPVAGMGLVDIEDRGESVRLAFLLVEALDGFAEVAQRRGDYGFVLTCGAAAQALRTQIEEHGWDGTGYRRGYREDGTPLGTGEADACRIDARMDTCTDTCMDSRIDFITQSWAVLSGGAEPGRAAAAVAALPPFDPQGLCGNGGGSAGAGIWAAMALARLGEEERAWALLEMLDPVRRGAVPDDVAHDGCVPYLLPDSVCYATPPIGHGDGSWYTGSAGWMYRLIVESLLGLERVGERLVLTPLLPAHWPGFRMRYRYRATVWEIEVRGAAAQGLLVDGRPVEGNSVQLVDDGAPHRVEVLVARRENAALAAHIDTQSKSMP